MKDKADRIIRKYKLDYPIVFVIIFVLGIMLREKTELSITEEHFRMLEVPGRLAGYRWEHMWQTASECGPGFFVLFTPLLSMVSNSVRLFNGIIWGSIATLGVAAMMVQYMLNKIVKHENIYENMFASIVGATFALDSIGVGYFNAESMVVLLTVMIGLCLAKILDADSVKVRILWSVIVAALFVYSYTVHQKNVILVVGITVVVACKLLENDKYKKLSVTVLGLVLFAIAGFVVYKIIPDNKAVGFIWTLLFNVYKSIIHTYGLILVAGYYLYSEIKEIVKTVRTEDECEYNIDATRVMFLLSAVVYVVALLRYTSAVAGEAELSGNWQYYGEYSVLMLAMTVIYAYKKVIGSKEVKWILGALPIALGVLVYIQKDWLPEGYIQTSLMVEGFNFGFTLLTCIVITVIITLMGLYTLLQTEDRYMYVYFLLGFYVIWLWGNGGLMGYTGSYNCNISYQIVEDILGSSDADADAEDKIVYLGNDEDYRLMQFMLKDIELSKSDSSTSLEEVIVLSDRDLNITEGYRVVQLDENEWAYTFDPGMEKIATRHMVELDMEQKDVADKDDRNSKK